MELYHLAVFVLLALIFLQLCRSDNVEKMSHKSSSVEVSNDLPCGSCTNMQPSEPSTMVCPQDCNTNPIYGAISDSIQNTPVAPMGEPSGVVDVSYYLPCDNLGQAIDSSN